MKLWEILPQLKEGQEVRVTYEDGSKADLVYVNGCVRHAAERHPISLFDYILEADFELIPQFIPFEEALAELRKGETICCEYDRKLPNETHWSGELIRITIAPDSLNQFISTDTLLHGKWWVK